MGNRHSTSRVTTPEGRTASQGSPPPYSSLPDSPNNAVEKPKQQLEKIKACKRCKRHYLESQLDNNLVNTDCGRYHPGAVQTRRAMFAERNNEIIKKGGRFDKYYDGLVWTCCYKECLHGKSGGVNVDNGCMLHEGKHES